MAAVVVEKVSSAGSVRAIDPPEDFSLILGGPLYQLLRRAHLSDDALELVRQRTIVIVAIVWAPLLVLSILEGHAWGAPGSVAFLRDIEANARFLIAMPLLILAELIVHRRMRLVVRQFRERELVPDAALTRFYAAVESAFRLRNSVLAEILLIAVVYIVGVMVVWRHYVAIPTATWYATPAADGLKLSLTGMWYVYVSVPCFQFLLLRWYYRIFVWARFLRQVSRIELSLIPTHPDRVGGLGFLSNVAFAFTPIAVAHGVLLAGVLANRIFYAGAALTDFKAEMALLVLFVMCVVLGPFLVFAPQLAAAKRTGLREYGTLAERYVREFDAKWLRGGAPPDEPLVGSGDVQSLADLANSFDVVKTMRIAPITRDALVRLAGATLAPVVPLALTMMSLEELLKKLFGMLF
jgi:AcrR family transcriptional regulator